MPTSAAAAAVLTEAYGRPVTVVRWERLGPWAVARAWLDGADGPATVVVKWTRTQGRARGSLVVERDVPRFLSRDLGLRVAPRVLASDLRVGVLVLEDLAPRRPLGELIRRDGAGAHAQRLTAFARVLGELGAATAGCHEAFTGQQATAAERFAALHTTAHAAGAFLGAPLGTHAGTELRYVRFELLEPGPFLALSNGDAEADNVLVHEDGPADARLIDFEAARFTHALADAVCLHVPGPAWMAVGDPVATGLADAYRRALSVRVREAEDDRRYGFGLAAACTAWALRRLERLPALDVRPVGDDSRAQLVETLDAAARTAEAHRVLPHLSGWVRTVADRLRHRWPDTTVSHPPYAPRRR